jgi:hypothetical protein
MNEGSRISQNPYVSVTGKKDRLLNAGQSPSLGVPY